MAFGPITSWQKKKKKEKVETVTDFLFLGSKITGDGDCAAMKLADGCFLAGKLWQTWTVCQGYGLSSSHVQM